MSKSSLIPDWCRVEVPIPSIEMIRSDDQANTAINILYEDTMEKHHILDKYDEIRRQSPSLIIRKLSEAIITEFRNRGPDGIRNMNAAIELISDIPEFHLYRTDNIIKMALESVVIGAFWRYIPVDGFINSPFKLLTHWSNFERERSHWWRSKKANETEEHIKSKWETLLNDITPLMHYHNALLHAKDMLEKPTLKHTCHLASLTAEGRIYENGQGRSIASECRHILVRTMCDIPIKSRPERRPAEHTGPPKEKKERKKREKPIPSSDDYGMVDDMSRAAAVDTLSKRPRRTAAKQADMNIHATYTYGEDDQDSGRESSGIYSYGASDMSDNRSFRRSQSSRSMLPSPPMTSMSILPAKLQRQGSAETWPAELARLGDNSSVVRNVPVFDEDMYAKIRQNHDGSTCPDTIASLDSSLNSAFKKTSKDYPSHLMVQGGRK